MIVPPLIAISLLWAIPFLCTYALMDKHSKFKRSIVGALVATACSGGMWAIMGAGKEDFLFYLLCGFLFCPICGTILIAIYLYMGSK